MKKSKPVPPVQDAIYQEQITVYVGPELKKQIESRGRAREFRSTSDYGRWLFRMDLSK